MLHWPYTLDSLNALQGLLQATVSVICFFDIPGVCRPHKCLYLSIFGSLCVKCLIASLSLENPDEPLKSSSDIVSIKDGAWGLFPSTCLVMLRALHDLSLGKLPIIFKMASLSCCSQSFALFGYSM